MKTVGESLEFVSFSIPDGTPANRGTAINIELFKDTEAGLAEESEKFPVAMAIPTDTKFTLFVDGVQSGVTLSKEMVNDSTTYQEAYDNEVAYQAMVDLYLTNIVKNGWEELEEFSGIAKGASKTLHSATGFSTLFFETMGSVGKGIESKDLTVMHYSGHGADSSAKELNGTLCFGEKDMVYPMIFQAYLSDVKGKVLLVLDSCFSGGFVEHFNTFEHPQTFTESLDTMLSVQLPIETNIWVLSASRAHETSADGGKGNLGFFTGQFIKALGAKVGDPIEDTPQDVKDMKELGFCSYVGPGLPESDSIWVSDILKEARAAMNFFKMEMLQYPMGGSYVDLRLFSGLNK